MEEFQIFYEIKSRRSAPFVFPDIVMRAVCEVELKDGLSKVEKRHAVARVRPRPWGSRPVSPYADH
jgi:hypothetical protein